MDAVREMPAVGLRAPADCPAPRCAMMFVMASNFKFGPQETTVFGQEHRLAPDFRARLSDAEDVAMRIAVVAEWIFDEYLRFFAQSRHLPWRALAVFEAREHARAVALGKLRLSLYSAAVRQLGTGLREAIPDLVLHPSVWQQVEAAYLPLIRGRYDADLAFAFLHSACRRVYDGEWLAVEYAFDDDALRQAPAAGEVYQAWPCAGPVTAETMQDILRQARFSVPLRDVAGDAELLAARLNATLAAEFSVRSIEMLRAGFFRNRGAYLVGRQVRIDGSYRPLVIALLNEERGIYAEALLTEVAQAHNLFSSTLATFHVSSLYYHEVAAFLHSIMPARPLGLHYSTIGYHHLGKVAVMREIERGLKRAGEVLDTAPGSRGTVAIGFTAPHADYVLKVFRDHPTAGYKWGTFPGVESVLRKYKGVHEINRTSSMLDNILFYNLKLDRSWFAPQLLAELAKDASNAVQLQGEVVAFRYLIVQRRMTPLNVFLQQAPPEQARNAVINLGHCIKNNAAANLFNRDFDARNYGVNRYGMVYLYDYDALEALTDVKVRTNLDRTEGEEGIPDWYFEEGVIFLPEELESGLRIAQRDLRQIFRASHGDLMTTAYWEALQGLLRTAQVPPIRTYPEECDLRPPLTTAREHGTPSSGVRPRMGSSAQSG